MGIDIVADSEVAAFVGIDSAEQGHVLHCRTCNQVEPKSARSSILRKLWMSGLWNYRSVIKSALSQSHSSRYADIRHLLPKPIENDPVSHASRIRGPGRLKCHKPAICRDHRI